MARDISLVVRIIVIYLSGFDRLDAEQYFMVNKIFDSKNLMSMTLCMDKMTLNWMWWREAYFSIVGWEDLKRELLQCF